MRLETFVPYLLVDDVAEASRFYVDHLGLESTVRLEWFAGMVHRERPEGKLVCVRRDHDSVPEAFRTRVRARARVRRRRCRGRVSAASGGRAGGRPAVAG